VTQPTKDELLKRFAAAQRAQDRAVMTLIYLELDEKRVQLLASRDQVTAARDDAREKLKEPRVHLDRLDQAVTAAEGRCVEWSQQLADPDPDVRAAARLHYEEWSAEVGKRRAERDQAERGYRELFEEERNRELHLRVLGGGIMRITEAQFNPFGDEMAQATDAYKQLRAPMLGPVLLRHEVDSPEWDQAVEQLRTWCRRSAYRTDDLPSNAEQMARAMTAAMGDGSQAVADPAPSMVEVVKQTEAHFENMALQARPVHVSDIDDRRNAQPVRTPARSYMEPPARVRDLGVR